MQEQIWELPTKVKATIHPKQATQQPNTRAAEVQDKIKEDVVALMAEIKDEAELQLKKEYTKNDNSYKPLISRWQIKQPKQGLSS